MTQVDNHTALPLDIFAIGKMQETRKAYHPGLTLVMGAPFEEKIRKQFKAERDAIEEYFEKHGYPNAIHWYAQKQLHASLIELASQWNESDETQVLFYPKELEQNKDKKDINVDHLLTWIKEQPSFSVAIKSGTLSKEHTGQELRLTENGFFVIKGRAVEADDQHLLSHIREEFEKKAGIRHKYGSKDDEFFSVLGYLDKDEAAKFIDDKKFLKGLAALIDKRRKNLNIEIKINQLSAILYCQRTLAPEARLDQWTFSLGKDPKIESLKALALQSTLKQKASVAA